MNPQPADREESARKVDRLFRDHNRELLRFLQAKLRSEDEARDVAQEAYVRLLQLENIGAVSFLRAYLVRIATNLAMDRMKARRRLPLVSEQDAPALEQAGDPLGVERVFLAAEELELFLKCLDELPPKCREVFMMQRMGQLGTQQVAAKLGISERMVRKHIARALIYCRFRLDGLGPKDALARLGEANG